MSQQRKDHREQEPAARPFDRREGQWTKLHLLEMDERFRTAVRRELTEPAASAGSRGQLRRAQ